jgi:hypothetical protein
MPIDDFFLPLDTTEKKLIAVFILEGTETMPEVEQMLRSVVGSLHNCGFYPDAMKFGFTCSENVVNIFIEKPIFDVYNHLSTC